MNSYDLIKKILNKEITGIPLAYHKYKGNETPAYIVFNEEDERPILYADDRPIEEATWWQIHIFTSKKIEFRDRIKTVKKILLTNDFTIEEIRTLEEENAIMHIVFSARYEEEGE